VERQKAWRDRFCTINLYILHLTLDDVAREMDVCTCTCKNKTCVLLEERPNRSNLATFSLFLPSQQQRPKQTDFANTFDSFFFFIAIPTQSSTLFAKVGGSSSKTFVTLQSSHDLQISRSRPRARQLPICNLQGSKTFDPSQEQQTTDAKISLPRLYRASQTLFLPTRPTLEAISDFLYGARRVLDLFPGWFATLACNGS
jgi:hypothetical protein